MFILIWEPMNIVKTKTRTSGIDASAPVVIGGLGGSGTRVLAEILQRLNYFTGEDLNAAHDNLFFTLIFKRPDWFRSNMSGSGAAIYKALNIFDKIMSGKDRLTLTEYACLIRIASDWAINGHNRWNRGASGQGIWPFRRLLAIKHDQGFLSGSYAGWGWKEPNTHVYLEYLNQFYPGMKYIHTIRHGLDMAFSANQSQLYSWAAVYGIRLNRKKPVQPADALDYWIQANQRVIRLGRQLLGDRFYLVNYDALCHEPELHIKRLINFLGVEPGQRKMTQLSSLPRLAPTVGRYKQQGLNMFTRHQLDAVRTLGFEIETPMPTENNKDGKTVYADDK